MIVVLRHRLSHSGLWVLAAVVAWAVAWIAALAGRDAAWQTEREVLSGVIEGAALSALPGVALVWLLRRPITANLPPFEWHLWLRWVLFSAGSAAIIGLAIGIVVRVMEETFEEEPLLGQGVFLLLLFTTAAMAIGAIQWQLLRQRLSLAGPWGLGSALGFLVLGFLWLMQIGGSGALGFLAGGLVAGLIQWPPPAPKSAAGLPLDPGKYSRGCIGQPHHHTCSYSSRNARHVKWCRNRILCGPWGDCCGRDYVSNRDGTDLALAGAAADTG